MWRGIDLSRNALQVICMMVPYAQIDPNAPYSTAFGQVGLHWAK